MELILLILLFIIFYIWDDSDTRGKKKHKNKPKPKDVTPTRQKPDIESIKATILKDAREANKTDKKKHNGNMFATAEEKAKYLKSQKWLILKAKRLRIADRRCEKCGIGTRQLHLHHITYERLLDEDINDLRILCSKCHSELHQRLGYSRTGILSDRLNNKG